MQDLDLRVKNIVPSETCKTAVGSEFIKNLDAWNEGKQVISILAWPQNVKNFSWNILDRNVLEKLTNATQTAAINHLNTATKECFLK